LQSSTERDREEEGFETPTWDALLECYETQNGQHLPFCREPAKNNKLMLARNVAKTLENM
jgi:hypothetical protein